MPTEKIIVPVDPSFWLFIDESDIERAEEMLIWTLKEVSWSSQKAFENDSILATHLRFYVTQGAGIDESTIRVDGIDWDEKYQSGKVLCYFEEYEYRGCSDLNYRDHQTPSIPFGMSTGKERLIWIEVLTEPEYFSLE